MWSNDEAYAEMSRHGVAFLRDEMWDAEHGGFYWLVARDGTPIPEADGRLWKQACVVAFGTYGLAMQLRSIKVRFFLFPYSFYFRTGN